MAAKEELVTGVTVMQAPPPPTPTGTPTQPVRQENAVKQEVVAIATPTVSVPTVYSDASPPQPLSPQNLFMGLGSPGVYPKPLATHDAVVSDEKLFMETFYSFHTALKSKPTIPKMGRKDLDVHLLYREVTSRGGLLAVIRDRKWKEITVVFQFPPTTTSASYVLRKYYITLLYHYEQVYKNGVTGPLIALPATLSGTSPSVQSGDPTLSEGGEPVIKKRVRKRRLLQVPIAADPSVVIGANVLGSIEGKLDFGYVVTMVVGGEQLKGILYHVPPGQKVGPQFATLPGLLNSMGTDLISSGTETTRRKRRRKDEMPKKDPNAPRPNRTGYNFFFAEQRQRLKLLHPDKDREISRMIGEAWNALSEEDKSPYQDRGVKDKERFKREFRDYKEKLKAGFYDNPSNGQMAREEAGTSPEDPSIPHNSPQPELSNAMAIDQVQQPAGNLSCVPKQAPCDPSGVSQQLYYEQKPTPLVSTQ